MHQRRGTVTIKFSITLILSTILVVSALVALPSIPNSYAHAFILKSAPSDSQTLQSAPSAVVVYFSDPIEAKYSQIKVLDSSGKQVDNKDLKYVNGDQTVLSVTLPPGLKNDIYTVSTRVLDATDGHVTDDAFVFGIGKAPPNSPSIRPASAQLQIPEAAARFPALVGQVLVVGVAFASLWLWRPVSRIGWLGPNLQQTRARMDARLTKLMVIAAIILVASGVGMIIVQANSIGAGVGDAIQTKFGNVWVIRMVQSAIVLAISLGMYNRTRKKSSLTNTSPKGQQTSLLPRGELVALFVVGIAVLATTTMISHAASTTQSTPVALDFVHNVVASIWIGGVVYLAFVVVPELKRKAKESSGLEKQAIASALTIIIPRFSIVVLALLGAIMITGPFLLYTLEPNLDLTLSSLYGKALIAKLIIAGGMAAVGGYNQRVIHREAINATVVAVGADGRELAEKRSTAPGRPSPKGSTASADNDPGRLHANNGNLDSALSKFKRSSIIESGLGMGLLVAVAVLVNTGTPASEFSNVVQQQNQSNVTAINPADQPFTQTQFVENASRVVLQISPFTPGNNAFTVSFFDQNRHPIEIKSVQLRYTQVDRGIGPITVDTKQISAGVYGANAAFGLSGHWILRVEGVPAKTNALSYEATYDLFVKPKPSQLTINIQEFRMPDNSSLPLYPLYDQARNSIWVGDTVVASGQLWEFNITSSKFVSHKLSGVNLATILSIDPSGKIWYIDPLGPKLGAFDPTSNKNQLYSIPDNGTLSGLATDDQHHAVWVVDSTNNLIWEFDTPSEKFIKQVSLPANGSQPFSITVDKSTGLVWVVDEALGKLAKIDPSNYNVTEYTPPGKDGLVVPTAMLIDPATGIIYISEHEGHAVVAFNPLLKTFTRYPLDQDPSSLPFGLAMDSNHLIWVAQHSLNKVAVFDPRTGEFNEVEIPLGATQTQWITSDSQGNIWLAEQRGAALGLVTSIANPSPPSSQGNSQSSSNQTNAANGIYHLGINFSAIVGPSVAAGVIGAAVLYTRSVQNLYQSIRTARGNDPGRPASRERQR